jgi:hypothetical protein
VIPAQRYRPLSLLKKGANSSLNRRERIFLCQY